MDLSDRLMSETEAAATLGYCQRTLYRLRKSGCGPVVVMVGERARYRENDLRDWIARRRGAPTVEK